MELENTTSKAQINTFKCVAPEFVCVKPEVLFEEEREAQWRLLMDDTKANVEEFLSLQLGFFRAVTVKNVIS